MTAKSYMALLGVVLVLIGGMCPMLRIPVIGKWNYWDIDTVLASIVYALGAVGLLASISRKQALLRFCGWFTLLMLIFTLAAVYLKVNDYFSFIPLRKLAAAASRMIRFQWLGWGLMFAGSLMIIIFSGKDVKVVPPRPGEGDHLNTLS